MNINMFPLSLCMPRLPPCDRTPDRRRDQRRRSRSSSRAIARDSEEPPVAGSLSSWFVLHASVQDSIRVTRKYAHGGTAA